MKTSSLIVAGWLIAGIALAQPPGIPPQAIDADPLPYRAVPTEEAFRFPDGMTFDSVAGLAFDSRGHLFVLHRGEQPLLEFDPQGNLVRGFGEGLFVRSHGLRIDPEDNLWVTDVSAHFVMKLDPEGRVLLTLGTPGEAGEWDEAAGSRRFAQPNDIAFAPNGDVLVAQGHGPAEPRVLRFTRDGEFVRAWGSRGDGPGEFAVAHSVVVDEAGRVYVADRENRRIQIFDGEGTFLDEWRYAGMACGLYLHGDGTIYMATGFDGQIVKLGANGEALGVLGAPGREIGEFGEAHYLALDGDGNIFVADVVNRRVEKFAPDARD